VQLNDRVAVITSVSGDVGQAIALRFAREGARLGLIDDSYSVSASLAEKIKKLSGEAVPLAADLTDKEQVQKAFAAVAEKYKRVDILVNATIRPKNRPLMEMSESAWQNTVDVHLTGVFNCTQAAIQYMFGGDFGRIINITIPVQDQFDDGKVNYAAASGGIEGLTKALSLELGKYNITVNCLTIDFIDTTVFRESARKKGYYLEDLQKLAICLNPLRRLGTVEEVAAVATFLASGEASFLTGQLIAVRGGP